MSLLSVLQFPDPRLKLVAKPVQNFGAELKQLCADMFETMYEFDGIGLAATQVNILQRIIVMDISENKTADLCLINPTIIEASDEVIQEEGCLSFPGVYGKVKRNAKITVEFFNPEGHLHQLTTDGLTAICIQHEIDHLNGITFYDHLSTLKQSMIRKKLTKLYDKTL